MSSVGSQLLGFGQFAMQVWPKLFESDNIPLGIIDQGYLSQKPILFLTGNKHIIFTNNMDS
jgi:hypothetical protein